MANLFVKNYQYKEFSFTIVVNVGVYAEKRPNGTAYHEIKVESPNYGAVLHERVEKSQFPHYMKSELYKTIHEFVDERLITQEEKLLTELGYDKVDSGEETTDDIAKFLNKIISAARHGS